MFVDIQRFEIRIKLFIALVTTSNKGVIHKMQTQREGGAWVESVVSRFYVKILLFYYFNSSTNSSYIEVSFWLQILGFTIK